MQHLQDELENEHFRVNDIIGPGNSFKQLLRYHRIPMSYISEVPASSWDTLAHFLEAIGIDNRTDLKEIFRKSPFVKKCDLNSEKLPIEIDFAQFQKRLAPMPVDIVLYFIEDMLLVRKVVPLQQPQSFLEKVIKIRSSLVWLAKIFEGAYWQDVFIDHERETLVEAIEWLDCTNHTDFVSGNVAREAQVEQEDREMADTFWNWLETHDKMPIKLVRAMILCGMTRDVKKEAGRVDDLVSQLRQKVHNHNLNLSFESNEPTDDNLDWIVRESHI